MIKLNFDYRDIKNIRELLNLTQEEVAFKVPVAKSYLSMIENGKRGLSMENYKRIFEVMNIPISIIADYNVTNIISSRKDTQSISKKTVLNRLNSLLESNKKEWCIDGVIAFNNLIKLYLGNEDRIFIGSLDYPFYKDGEDVSYDYLGKTLTFDRKAFEKLIMDDNFDENINSSWSIPTKEGFFIDLYLLDSNISFDNDIPIKEGFSYITTSTKKLMFNNVTIEKGTIGYLDEITIIDGIKKYLMSFVIDNKTYKHYYDLTDIELFI